MKLIRRLILGTSVLSASLCAGTHANEPQAPYVRIAELEVDTAQLEGFTAAVREVGQVSVRVEPGCLVLYAVSEKENPGRVRVFEIYRDEDAYKTHLQTPHFKKFRVATDGMVKSRTLIDAVECATNRSAQLGEQMAAKLKV